MGVFSFQETLAPFIKKAKLKPLGCTSALPIRCYLKHLAGSRAGFLADHEWWFIPGREDRGIFRVIFLSHVDHHCQQTPNCRKGAEVACSSTSLLYVLSFLLFRAEENSVALGGAHAFYSVFLQHPHQGSVIAPII